MTINLRRERLFAFFRPTVRVQYEHMFFSESHETGREINMSTSQKINRAFANSVDLVVDFATLGEYRVITESAPRKVEAQDIWATDVEWSPADRTRTSSACSLPRARDRKLARAALRG